MVVTNPGAMGDYSSEVLLICKWRRSYSFIAQASHMVHKMHLYHMSDGHFADIYLWYQIYILPTLNCHLPSHPPNLRLLSFFTYIHTRHRVIDSPAVRQLLIFTAWLYHQNYYSKNIICDVIYLFIFSHGIYICTVVLYMFVYACMRGWNLYNG